MANYGRAGRAEGATIIEAEEMARWRPWHLMDPDYQRLFRWDVDQQY
jgi:hypothetical protein